MRLFKNEVKTEPGYLVAVNCRIATERPLFVGKEDAVHFVSFAPAFSKVTRKAFCQEGVAVEMIATVRLELSDKDKDLEQVYANAGYRTYREPVKVSPQSVADQAKLLDSLVATLETFIRKSEFFDLLRKQQDTQAVLNQLFQQVCNRTSLVGEVVSLEATPVQPDEKLLADLAARAGLTEVAHNGVRTRTYTDTTLGAIVEYFIEANRQKELLKAQDGLAKAEGERVIVEAQQQIIKARNDLKIVETEEEHRRSKRQAELDGDEAAWGEAAMRRNAAIKETNAAYEFEYKKKRAAETMELAQKDTELTRMKEETEASLRKAKRADLDDLDLYREREIMKIRLEEKRQFAEALAAILDHAKNIPVPDYHGIGTLILPGGESQDATRGLLVALLAKLSEAAAALTPSAARLPAK